MTREETNRIVSRYVCAQCWHHLIIVHGMDDPVCSAYGTQHSGKVTKRYADRKRQEDAEDYMEAREVLREAGIIAPRQSQQQNMKELGF